MKKPIAPINNVSDKVKSVIKDWREHYRDICPENCSSCTIIGCKLYGKNINFDEVKILLKKPYTCLRCRQEVDFSWIEPKHVCTKR